MSQYLSIKNREDDNLDITLVVFSNFQELHNFIRFNCVQKDEHTYDVALEDLKILKEELLPIAKILINIPERLLGKFDDHGYPKKYKLNDEELIHEDFNPITSQSAYAGCKTMKLYDVVCAMIHFLEDDLSDNFYIEYCCSY